MIPHNNQLNYVASGMQFLRFPYVESLANEEGMAMMGTWLRRLDHSHSHRFSVLFNAFTEKKVAEPVRQFIKPHVYDIHADSGGLQIVSRGFTADTARKQQVYDVQAGYCDTAMSFDEIPAYIIGNQRALKDSNLKVFDRSRLEACAHESGKNLRTQILSFIEKKSEAKPLAIIQGNDLETASIWVDEMFKEIPKELLGHIRGVAIGSPCIGSGEVEAIEKLFWFTELNIPIKNPQLHILGMGTIKGILPLACFFRSGMIHDTHVSYDSTTHTAMNIRGRYYFGRKPGLPYQTMVNKIFIPEYEDIFNDIIQFAPELKRWTPDAHSFFHHLIEDAKKQKAETGTQMPLIMAVKAHGFSCMNNFMQHAMQVITDDEVFREVTKTEQRYQIYKTLEQVKNKTDYYYWKAANSRFLESNPVRTNVVTLEDFFA